MGIQSFFRIRVCLWLLATVIVLPRSLNAQTNAMAQFRWHEAQELCIEGKGWSDTKEFYDRLPARAEGVVRGSVWGLSRNSAGLCVTFVSDATTISARWSLRNPSLAMAHMPATGVSGLDLYVKTSTGWRWLGNGRPGKQDEEKILVKGLAPGEREFILYLPLYNGVKELAIGVPTNAMLRASSPRTVARKPVVFYGTSILQGGCASRPGMAYPAILGRWLDWPTINLGFSGNAHCEPEVAALLAELDPAVYVLDPLANMTPTMVNERMENFVRTLRKAHPLTPIVLVENAKYPDEDFLPAKKSNIHEENANLRTVYDRLVRSGEKRLFYARGDQLLGDDGEATVDGTHPNDVGFIRMAKALESTIKRACKAAR